MKLIDLLNIKANAELMPKSIRITQIDYEMEYYLDDNFWYRSIKDDKRLEILPNILNVEVEVIKNEYRLLVQEDKIIEEEKEIEELPDYSSKYNDEVVYAWEDNEIILKDKINELIRKVNKIRKEGK